MQTTFYKSGTKLLLFFDIRNSLQHFFAFFYNFYFKTYRNIVKGRKADKEIEGAFVFGNEGK